MSAEDRIRLIEGSVRCFRCSWLSLIPLVGVAFAMACLLSRARVRRQAWKEWNPAARLLAWSGWIAAAGILFSIVEIVWWLVYLVGDT